MEGLLGRWVGGKMSELPILPPPEQSSQGVKGVKWVQDRSKTRAAPECIRSCSVVAGMLQA